MGFAQPATKSYPEVLWKIVCVIPCQSFFIFLVFHLPEFKPISDVKGSLYKMTWKKCVNISFQTHMYGFITSAINWVK